MSWSTVMFAELRSARKDFIPTKAGFKRVAIRCSPLIAAGAAGTAGLCIRKLQEPPEAPADFVRSKLSVSSSPRKLLVDNKEVTSAGEDLEALKRAARRMRGPIERDLLAAECLLARETEGPEVIPDSAVHRATRALHMESASSGSIAELRRQLWTQLVKVWRSAGYFDEPVVYDRPTPSKWKALNPASGEDEAYGRDVGCEVPLCMLEGAAQPDASYMSPSEWSQASSALEAHGVVHLRKLISRSEIAGVRRKLEMHESALDARSRSRQASGPDVGHIREYKLEALFEVDEELQFISSSIGRKHFCLRGRVLEEAVSNIQAAAMPLVWEHLSSVTPSSSSRQEAYVSEVQLLVTEPGAVEQFWHVDNAHAGLTLVVPLTPLPDDMGANLIMPGSHHLFDGGRGRFDRCKRFASSILGSNGLPLSSLEVGDAMLYDSRLIHRGTINQRYSRTGVALVFRYDYNRPPGYGAMGTVAISWAGSCLASVMNLYAKLPGK